MEGCKIDAGQDNLAEFADRLTRSQLIALNRQGRVSNFVPPVNIVIVVAMLCGIESPLLLLVWGGLVWSSSLIRFVMYRRFDRAVDAGKV